MTKSNERFIYLLQAYTSGTITAGEHEELFDLIATHQYDSLLAELIQHDLSEGQPGQTAGLPPHISEEIMRNIYKAEKETTDLLPRKKTSPVIVWRWAAVAAILIAVTSYFFFSIMPSPPTNQPFSSLIPENTIIRKNESSEQQTIILPDSSRVLLQPHSRLHYQFAADKREVFLEGEAFFKVTKNPSRPFLVYYDNIITRVLGTSFTINTNSQTGNVEVSVKTGKVQVYENRKLLKQNNSSWIILTPNQKGVYKPQERIFETSLVEKPQPIVDENEEKTIDIPFVYEQEKLLNVFRHIETNYGIEIVLKNSGLNDCVFTGDVSAQDLNTKLKIICLATNSSYEINGTKILITGNGCKKIVNPN